MGEHAPISPSAMDRIISCPASVNLSKNYENKSSEFADEGTKAHEELELCLNMGTDSANEYIQMALDYIKERQAKGGMDMVHSESKVSLDFWLDRDDVWGTADIVMHDYGLNEIEIADLKYGKGVIVEPKDNWQLISYALGALVKVTPKGQKYPEKITVTIIQPRIEHEDGIVRSHTYTLGELMVLKEQMKKALDRVNSDTPEYGPSRKACRWCLAKGDCEQRAGHNLAELGLSFDPVSPSELEPTDTISMDRRVQILDAAEEIRAWLSDVEESAVGLLMNRKKVPDYKLVRGRANRKWKGEEEEIISELKSMGVKQSEFLTNKLVSPAAIEKVVKARKFKKPKRDRIAAMIEKPEGKLTLVHETDSRPAAILPLPDNAFEDVTKADAEDDLASFLS